MPVTSTQRISAVLQRLTLTPHDPLPESFLNRFPELRPWDQRRLEVDKLNEAEIGRAIALADKQPRP